MPTYATALTRSLTSLAQTATAQHLDRIICAHCIGYGADVMSLECDYCTKDRWCDLHRCKPCQGLGVCCPRCKGARWLRSGQPGNMVPLKDQTFDYASDGHDARKGMATGTSMYNSALSRCGMCSVANDKGKLIYNAERELSAIRAYLQYPNAPEWQQRKADQANQDAAEKRSGFITTVMAETRKLWQGRPLKVWMAARDYAVNAWETHIKATQ